MYAISRYTLYNSTTITAYPELSSTMEDQPTSANKQAGTAAAAIKRKSKLKSRGGGSGNGSRCDGTSVLEKVTANNDGDNPTSSSTIAPVTPGGGHNSNINISTADNSTIDLTNSTPAKKVACEDHFFSSPVVEIVSKTNKAASKNSTTSTGNDENKKRKRVSTSPTSLEVTSMKGKDDHSVEKKKKKKKNLQKDDDMSSAAVGSSKQKKSIDNNTAAASTVKAGAATKPAESSTKAAATTAAPSKKSPTPPQEQQQLIPALKKVKKRSFHDQILYTMLTSNKPYNLKSLAKATKTTVEQLNHAMLSFVDKGLVIVKEFPSKANGREGKKLYWATTVTLSDNNGDDDDDNDKKKQKKGSNGAIQKELSKLMATPNEMKEINELHTTLEQRYRSIQEELQPLLQIPTMKELDEDIEAEEQTLKGLQQEIDAIRNRIREQSSEQKKPLKPMVQYGGYYRMQQQQRRATPSEPADPSKLKRKINDMLSEYKGRKRKCMDFVNDLADAMEKHPRDVMNEKILGLDTDEMEWGWWLDCSTGKIFGTKPKVSKKKLLMGQGGRHRHGANEEEGEEDTNEPKVKIPAKYVDL